MPTGKLLFFSSQFSQSQNLGVLNLSTGTFTASSPFTPSNFFTPNRTKVPDPQNIFHRAEISGQQNHLYSKEEIKKSAAPLSISAIVIVVSVVMSILYLRRKLYEIRHSNSVPVFDTSFNDEDEEDSSNSYSYYTYTYTYCTSSDSYSFTEGGYSQCNENSRINYDYASYSDFINDEINEYNK